MYETGEEYKIYLNDYEAYPLRPEAEIARLNFDQFKTLQHGYF